MTNFNELQPRNDNNNLFENYENSQLEHSDNFLEMDYTPPNMIDFGKKTQSIMENFKKCTQELEFDNSRIMTYVVDEVGKQRKIFRKFVQGSIKFSKNLEDYSIDILFFADSYKNNRYSNEDFLDMLNDLLIKSKENHRLIKELKNIIKAEEENISEIEDLDEILKNIKNNGPENLGIMNELTNIGNFLSDYIEIIKKHPELIDSDKNFKIVKEKYEKSKCQSKSIAFTAVAAIAGIGLLAVTGPVGAAVVAAEEIAFFGTSTAFYTFVGLVEYIKAGKKDKSINNLEKELNIEVNELIEKIKSFSTNLNSIVGAIGNIETFWQNQIERIKVLIKELEGFKEEKKRYKKDQIVNAIEKKWKDVERECQIYSLVMKDLLNEEKLCY
ncbi:hypothetical protein RclHR1_08720011 [Rhizophagus clarus]|uniref:Uncharacterized protein n=1 Tax=Rhizophagus clarus TaxID=94130 RepID=A0A2Z6S1P1_9GLOM|nr:hypothetical protein RclHR1_08720011 [Rhizophagus clarus]GES82581.1 hypothetical protein GLOIN_2v1777098 [Rhizophagus clarus]